jgi:DNA modification methylase
MAQRSSRPARRVDPDVADPGLLEIVPTPQCPAPVLPIHPKTRRSDALGARQRRSEKKEPASTLWYGDNLEVLREQIPSESTDLVYLDPPFNSNRAYNIIFKGPAGAGPPSQIQAFDDTWTWTDETNHTLASLATAHMRAHRLVAGLVEALDRTDLSAYLVMMAVRLVELHLVLRPTGSLYLHCDPTASHYLKIILDAIFGPTAFRSAIIWRRTRAHNDRNLRKFGAIHDSILFYSKSKDWTFNRIHTARADHAPMTHDLYRHSDGILYRKGDCRAPGDRGPKYDWHGHVQHWRFTEEEASRLEQEGELSLQKPECLVFCAPSS